MRYSTLLTATLLTATLLTANFTNPTNNVFLDKKSKNTTTTKQKIKHKKPLPEQAMEARTSRIHADALPLHHRVN